MPSDDGDRSPVSESVPLDEPRRGLKFGLRALSSRNYRLYFTGQGVSLIGTWMQSVALSWLVYRLTSSPFLLGVVGFAGQIPAFVLTPFAGVLADRLNRYRMLLITQSLAMVQAFLLAWLVLAGKAQIWQIIALAGFLGLVNAFDMPTRQAFLVDIVERREDLPNAIALNSALFNGARLIGPSVAGLLIAVLGEGMCFLVNGVSYLAVLAALVSMQVRMRPRAAPARHVLHELREGLTYAFGFAPIATLLTLLALVSLVGMPYVVLMPVFVRDVLHGTASTQGFLMGASGLGALIGAVFLASRGSVRGLGRFIPMATSLFGVGLVGLSQARTLWLALPAVLIAGLGMMVQMAASNTILQTIVEEDKRGRVMALYTTAFMGMAPFGSLLAGAIANRVGAPNTLLAGGLCCVAAAGFFSLRLKKLRELVRPIYIRLGIIPEVASGLQSATHLPMPPES